MPRARDLLARFRPVGAPGAAAPAGVPVDRVAERERELRPIFEELAAAEAEAARIRAAATADAEARATAAAEQARAVVDNARRDAEAHRAHAAAAVLRRAEQEAMTVRAAAERESGEIAARATDRLPALLTSVVDAVRMNEPIGTR